MLASNMNSSINLKEEGKDIGDMRVNLELATTS